MTILGLILVAVGTGGIKPCVCAFSGEQFKLPEQTAEVTMFFSMFYFIIYVGSLTSTIVTPILRQDVKCFGEDDCFMLAWGLPGVLMIISVGKFVVFCLLKMKCAPNGDKSVNPHVHIYNVKLTDEVFFDQLTFDQSTYVN